MDTFTGEMIGGIHINVYQTEEGLKFFELQGDNEKILPVLDVIEKTLIKY